MPVRITDDPGNKKYIIDGEISYEEVILNRDVIVENIHTEIVSRISDLVMGSIAPRIYNALDEVFSKDKDDE